MHVRTHCTATVLGLEVRNNGLGLSAEQQSKPFATAACAPTSRVRAGALYSTKRLMENSGGAIAVESQVAVGTTCILTFPA